MLHDDWPLLPGGGALRRRFCEYLQPPDELEVAEATARIAVDLRRQAGAGIAAFLFDLARYMHATYVYDRAGDDGQHGR